MSTLNQKFEFTGLTTSNETSRPRLGNGCDIHAKGLFLNVHVLCSLHVKMGPQPSERCVKLRLGHLLTA